MWFCNTSYPQAVWALIIWLEYNLTEFPVGLFPNYITLTHCCTDGAAGFILDLF